MGKKQRISYKDCHKIIDGIEYKLCKECLNWFPLNAENFKVQPSQKDGYSHRCITCNYNYAHARYMKNRDKEIAKQQQKQRDNPEYYREYNRKRYLEKRDDYFRPLILKHERENKERYQKWTREWRKRNPDKQKQYAENHRNHDIYTQEWKDVQEYFNYACAYCGKTLEEQYNQNKQQFHKEHMDHQGYNDVRNCVPSCSQCNSKKRAKTIDELFELGEIETFTKDKYNKIMQWCNEDYKQYIIDKPPYRITKKQNKDGRTYHWELWTVDDKRNFVECIAIGDKKKDLKEDIEKYLKQLKHY